MRRPRPSTARRAVRVRPDAASRTAAEPDTSTAAAPRRLITRRAGRRIAILGDMLELGDDAVRFHEALAPQLIEAGIDLVFTVGANMASLDQALPPSLRGGHAEDAHQLLELIVKSIRPGDAVMVKGSFGSRMGSVVKALENMAEPQPSLAAEG